MGIKKGPLRPLFSCLKTRMINCGQGCRTAWQFVREVLARYIRTRLRDALIELNLPALPEA